MASHSPNSSNSVPSSDGSSAPTADGSSVPSHGVPAITDPMANDPSPSSSTYALSGDELPKEGGDESLPSHPSPTTSPASHSSPNKGTYEQPLDELKHEPDAPIDYGDADPTPWRTSDVLSLDNAQSTFLDAADTPGSNPGPGGASSSKWPVSSRTAASHRPGPRKPEFEYAQEDIKALRAALKDNNLFRLSFYFLDYILRAQTALFEQIHLQQQLPRIIASMSILSAILSAIYGLTMGMDHSLLQSVAAAIKLPILFVLTAIICIPSLYTFNVLLGQRFKFLQTVTLMVMTLGTTSILLASLAPIAFFFSLTTPQYSFLLLLHVSIFALCGVYGVQYLYRGCAYLAFRMEQPLNNLLLRIWIVIYGLVGMQLGWRLRPFVGSDGSPFQIFRSEQGGNFYIAVWNALSSLFGGG